MRLNLVFILILCACQTIGSDEDTNRSSELLNSQKALLVNYLNQGKPSMAVKELRPLLAQHPDDEDFLNLMGLAQLALGQAKQALPYFRQSFKKGTRIAIGLNLSSALIETGELVEARALLAKLLSGLEPQGYQFPERIHHNLGLTAEKLGDYAKAEEHYLAALAENEDFYISHMKLAEIYDRTHRSKLARDQLRMAIRICRTCLEPTNALALNLLTDGKKDSALKLIRHYLLIKELNPQDRVRAIKLKELAEKSSTK